MGRELRRVPLDFDWPENKVWKGYVTPERYQFPQCPDCKGEWYSPEALAIADTFYPHRIQRDWSPGAKEHADALAWHDKLGQAEVDNLVAKGRLWDFWRHWEKDKGWVDNDPPTKVLAADVNAAQAGNPMSSHDAINRGILIRFRCEMLGVEESCSTCQGHGSIATDEQRAEADAWEWEQPPTGEGYQLWETTSEGSPISPVFDTLDALCIYAENHCSTFGASKTTAAQWKSMLDDGLVTDEWVAADGTRVVML